jgi:hypothetical protein
MLEGTPPSSPTDSLPALGASPSTMCPAGSRPAVVKQYMPSTTLGPNAPAAGSRHDCRPGRPFGLSRRPLTLPLLVRSRLLALGAVVPAGVACRTQGIWYEYPFAKEEVPCSPST